MILPGQNIKTSDLIKKYIEGGINEISFCVLVYMEQSVNIRIFTKYFPLCLKIDNGANYVIEKICIILHPFSFIYFHFVQDIIS